MGFSAYVNKDRSKVVEKQNLMYNFVKSKKNKCENYSPVFYDKENDIYFILIDERHKQVLGLKTYEPIDVSYYFEKTNENETI